MKTFNEILLEKKTENIEVEFTEYGDFDSVNSAAESAANIVAKQNYKILLEDMARTNPDVLDWNFVDGKTKTKTPDDWARMNPTAKGYMAAYSSTSEYGISVTLKMKFPIKKKIDDLDVVVGDVPEYTFVVDMIFNTTGNKASTSIYSTEGKLLGTLSDTIGFTKLTEKIRTIKRDTIDVIFHKNLYMEWVKTQKDHPLRGTVAGKKYGV